MRPELTTDVVKLLVAGGKVVFAFSTHQFRSAWQQEYGFELNRAGWKWDGPHHMWSIPNTIGQLQLVVLNNQHDMERVRGQHYSYVDEDGGLTIDHWNELLLMVRP